MRTTFALFSKYDDAKKIVDELMNKNFEKEDINIIAQKSAVENSWSVNERTIDVEVTKEVGKQTRHGLDAMLGRQQPVRTTTAGDVYATGEVAKIIARSAAAPGAPNAGLRGALVDFGVAEDSAKAFEEGIRNGQMLIFVRSSDDRASEAKEAISAAPATHIITAAG